MPIKTNECGPFKLWNNDSARIPEPVRKALGLERGDQFIYSISDDGVKIVKVQMTMTKV